MKLSETKAKVICLDALLPEDEKTSKKINIKGGEAYYYRCNVGSEEDVLRVLNLINKEVGDITMFFNCYLFPDDGTIQETGKEIIDRCIVGNFYVSSFKLINSNLTDKIIFQLAS